ncbi:phosphoesterase PA-phosphatase related protein [Emticicia oligotrophica DSM 17448]|uniref:Phosphoesterase PA-phosphatase related protein n=1 Tax=Emticicia oligotrophica (strain DSM 17448 / CIP 109782 / MTCC 6937 / GPTSA100-15) TaxID=929562 RepID=A0ABM5N6R1_EMTOG|nr:vanadium-dependent haloperoxidase [Emticicia oligotrophica]AFK05226.1 phosphoesterase PA-phosphatase related protein [Emticicia oligotrophica DSM 17448]
MRRRLTLLFILICTFGVQAQTKKTSTKKTTTKSTIKPKSSVKSKNSVEKSKKAEKVIEKEEEDLVEESENIQDEKPILTKVEPARIYDYKNSDLLVKWHELIFELIEQTQGYSPNVAARNMAYINLAAYESILPANLGNLSLSGQLQDFARPDSLNIDSRQFNASVALNSAVFKLVDKFFISAPYIWMEKVYALNDSVNNHFSRIISPEAMRKSKIYGAKIAYWIYEYSRNDGGHQSFVRTYSMGYKLPVCQSCFEINRVADLENTGPLHPKWGGNRTFLMENQLEIDIKPTVEFSIYPNSPFYMMAKEVYDISKQVVPNSEKLQIANFWDDAATFTYTAPGHSVSILVQVLKQKPVELIEAAELLSNLTLAINDAFIVTWKIKYQYNLIRPITYIKRYIDNQWEPALLTPPFPEFPSGHSAQTSTMATVLTSKLGDNVSFIDYSKYFVGPPKKFQSFWAAAKECSISRVYGGIHFRDAIEQGEELGKIIGKNALTLRYKK